MKSVLISFLLLLISGSASADARNELGTCLFNVTNELLSSELNPESKLNLQDFREESMVSINQACTDLKKAPRETCQINLMLDAFTNLSNKYAKSQKAIEGDILKTGPCLYLTLFK